jgi:hypothetical protein
MRCSDRVQLHGSKCCGDDVSGVRWQNMSEKTSGMSELINFVIKSIQADIIGYTRMIALGALNYEGKPRKNCPGNHWKFEDEYL